MPVPKGVRIGGRSKGTPNKSTAALKDRLASWNCDPFEVMANIAKGDLPCGVCRGAGKTPYQAENGKTGERKCESCYGSGKERINPAERNRAAIEIAKYCEPQRKAVEISGDKENPVQHAIRVTYVDPPKTKLD